MRAAKDDHTWSSGRGDVGFADGRFPFMHLAGDTFNDQYVPVGIGIMKLEEERFLRRQVWFQAFPHPSSNFMLGEVCHRELAQSKKAEVEQSTERFVVTRKIGEAGL